jgi:septum site-determining protein MinC
MPKAPKAIEFKISTVVAVSVLLNTSSLEKLAVPLADLTGEGAYFSGEFAVIDVRAIAGELDNFPWDQFVAMLKSAGLHPVAVRNAPEVAHSAIARAGLTLDALAPRAVELPAADVVVEEAPAPVAPPPAPTAMVVEGPIRTGNRVYAKGVDLIVMGSVSPGAEIIADGNVHVYGALRGRALAGASGNGDARIFAMSLEAELVSVAGVYRTFENANETVGMGAMQVRLQGERIDIIALAH